MVFIWLYIASALFSMLINNDTVIKSLTYPKFNYMLYPFIASTVFIQTLEKKHIKIIAKYFVLFAVVNVLISFVQMKSHFQNITWEHTCGLFSDRNMFARFLIIVTSYLLIKLLSQKWKTIFDPKIFILLLVFICITFLLSRSGYIMYTMAIAFVIWKKKRQKTFKNWIHDRNSSVDIIYYYDNISNEKRLYGY